MNDSADKQHRQSTFPLRRVHIRPDAVRARDVDAITACLSDDDVRSTVLIGRIDRVIDQLWRMKTPLVDQVTIRPYALDGESFASTVRVFAEHVWPAAREAFAPQC